MSKTYTEQEIRNRIVERLEPDNLPCLYRSGWVNHTERLKSGVRYTEIVADEILRHCAEEELIILEKPVQRKYSYDKGRKRPVSKLQGFLERKDKGEFLKNEQKEKYIAMELFEKQALPPLGKVISYEVPLGDGHSGGAIDLLAYDDTANTLYPLELKCEDSGETLLRCVLEVWTYTQKLYREKFCKDFKAPNATIVPLALVFEGSVPACDFDDEGQINVKKLMRVLGVGIAVLGSNREIVKVWRHP